MNREATDQDDLADPSQLAVAAADVVLQGDAVHLGERVVDEELDRTRCEPGRRAERKSAAVSLCVRCGGRIPPRLR